jgi:LDH2 family malate/lactate/ureidoglycolate dehydrogenase
VVGTEVSERVSVAALEAFAASVLRAVGVADEEADSIAGYLAEANARGIDGHGVLRLPQYVRSIQGGHINRAPTVSVIRRTRAVAVVDADGGYGFRPSRIAMDHATVLAETFGIAAVGVTRSHHFGVASLYVRQAAERGQIGIAISNTRAVMAPPGGAAPIVGNDPIAIAAPRRSSAPIVVDIALSNASWGKINLAATRAEAIPAGWALDAQGRETTSATEALASNLLVPIGGYKGFALAFLFELLAGALTDAPVGPLADGHSHRDGGCGHLFVAIEPDHFLGRSAFLERTEQLVAAMSASATANGVAPRLPGARSDSTRAERLALGVPIPNDLRAVLNDLSSSLGAHTL